MTYSKSMMDEDEEGVLLVVESMLSHFHAIMTILQSPDLYRRMFEAISSKEAALLIICTALLIISLFRFSSNNRLSCWFNSITIISSFNLSSQFDKGSEWSEEGDHSYIHSTQGRRSNNEDRAEARTIPTETGDVYLYTVMDGHGGEFCVNHVSSVLSKQIEIKIRKIKLITSKKSLEVKTAEFKQHFGEVPTSVLSYLNGENYQKSSEQNSVKANGVIPDGIKSATIDVKSAEISEDTDTSSISSGLSESANEDNIISAKSVHSRQEIVLNSGRKSFEDLALPKQLEINTCKNIKKKEVKKKEKPKTTAKDDNVPKETELVDYIGSNGDVLYAKLIREEILACDKELIKHAKKANAIGGTTLLIAVVDRGTLWVANVGDSRGVYCCENGQVGPLSFDHKPSQLKEKRRIQAAGGFISLIGVWRVQGRRIPKGQIYS